MSNETSVSSAGGSQGVDRPGASSSVPIGLGMGDLQPKVSKCTTTPFILSSLAAYRDGVEVK